MCFILLKFVKAGLCPSIWSVLGNVPCAGEECRIWCSGTKGSVTVDMSICFNMSVKADNSLSIYSLVHIQEYSMLPEVCKVYYPVYICCPLLALISAGAPPLPPVRSAHGVEFWKGCESRREPGRQEELQRGESRPVVSQGRRESRLKARAVPVALFN